MPGAAPCVQDQTAGVLGEGWVGLGWVAALPARTPGIQQVHSEQLESRQASVPMCWGPRSFKEVVSGQASQVTHARSLRLCLGADSGSMVTL